MEQDRIWDHYQTTRVDAFGRAQGRYSAMVREARRRHGAHGGRALNIGIGAGGVERQLQALGWRVAALDPSEAAAASLAQAGIDARCGYAQQMPFADSSFDIVVASEVLEHIEPAVRQAVLAEIVRVLAPGGWFIGSVPYREVLQDSEVICPDCSKIFHRWGHVSSFDLPQIEAELATRFTDVSCRRRSFVDWAAASTPVHYLKGVIHSVLGRLGEQIVSPNILFAARKAP